MEIRLLTRHAGCAMLSVDSALGYCYREASIARNAPTIAERMCIVYYQVFLVP